MLRGLGLTPGAPGCSDITQGRGEGRAAFQKARAGAGVERSLGKTRKKRNN